MSSFGVYPLFVSIYNVVPFLLRQGLSSIFRFGIIGSTLYIDSSRGPPFPSQSTLFILPSIKGVLGKASNPTAPQRFSPSCAVSSPHCWRFQMVHLRVLTLYPSKQIFRTEFHFPVSNCVQAQQAPAGLPHQSRSRRRSYS